MRAVDSTGPRRITYETWLMLHEEIQRAADHEEPPDGVVITHGSNTVEETAYFLHLISDTEMPVALTAAQRNHGLVGNDGDRNLVNAIWVAANPDSQNRGALVVLNDRYTRRWRHKDGERPDAWHSANLGVLGLIDKRDNTGYLCEITQRHAPDTGFDASDLDPGRDAAGPNSVRPAEINGAMVGATVDNGADGIVLAGNPTGCSQDRPVHGCRTRPQGRDADRDFSPRAGGVAVP